MYNAYTLCSKHFEDSQFMNPAKKNSLIHTAVPTIFDVPNPPPSVTPKRPLPKHTCATPPPKPSTAMTQPCSPTEEANDEEGNTTKVLLVNINVNSKSSDKSINNKNNCKAYLIFSVPEKRQKTHVPDTPRKIKLKKTVKALRVQLQRERKKKTLQKTKTLQLKNALKCIAEYLPPDTVSFIESQVEMSKQCKRAYRWKTKDKMIALSIFFHSQKVYKILSKLFILPSKSTLLRDLKKMNMKPGFIESILEALQVKVNTMDTRD